MKIGHYYEFEFLGFTVIGRYIGEEDTGELGYRPTFHVYYDECPDGGFQNGKLVIFFPQWEMKNLKEIKKEEMPLRILELS
jgi:hypothetical protein